MLYEYLVLAIYAVLALLISVAVVLISVIGVYQNPDAQKSAPYECGFSPFGDSLNRFEVRFYLVAISFIIFDLEVSFLFPCL